MKTNQTYPSLDKAADDLLTKIQQEALAPEQILHKKVLEITDDNGLRYEMFVTLRRFDDRPMDPAD